MVHTIAQNRLFSFCSFVPISLKDLDERKKGAGNYTNARAVRPGKVPNDMIDTPYYSLSSFFQSEE